MKFKAILAFILILALTLPGCGIQNGGSAEPAPGTDDAQTPVASDTAAPAADTTDMFTSRDLSAEYDESNSALIQLNGDSASCDSDAVQISGSTVTITDEGTYILTGALYDGMIIVNADENDKPQLVLIGVSITSKTTAPLYIPEADKVVITLADGSINTLSNGGTFTAIDDNNIDGAVFSKADLSFNGSGSLTIASPAGHGIVCKDDLVFTGGTYEITSASHGIDANDSVRTTGAVFTIASGKDGIHSENTDDTSLGFVYVADGTFNIEAEGDGISAGAYMQINDGSFDIISGGGSVNAAQHTSGSWGEFGGHGGGMNGGFRGEKPQRGRPSGTMTGLGPLDRTPGSMQEDPAADPPADAVHATEDTGTSIKGIKATGNLVINGGTFTVDSADGSVHSNASITVNNGTFDLKSGDDGFHADETLTVADGTINISESYEGIEGLHVSILGGNIWVKATDDGLNAAGGTDQSGFGGKRGNENFGGGMSSSSGGSIAISGGELYVNASGDGLDANGSLEISGGKVIVSGPTTGDTSVLDFDASGIITGGTFVGTGAAHMAQTFSSSEQGVIFINTGNQPAGTLITLTDSNGNTVISHEPDQSFAIAILSNPNIVKGETYTLSIGSNSEELTAS